MHSSFRINFLASIDLSSDNLNKTLSLVHFPTCLTIPLFTVLLFITFYYFLIIIILALIILSISFLNKEKITEAEKISQYECGFQPFYLLQLKFEIHFYLVAILFIIFDLEIERISILFSASEFWCVVNPASESTHLHL